MTNSLCRTCTIGLLLALLLSACGNKGPLYLPEPAPPSSDQTTED